MLVATELPRRYGRDIIVCCGYRTSRRGAILLRPLTTSVFTSRLLAESDSEFFCSHQLMLCFCSQLDSCVSPTFPSCFVLWPGCPLTRQLPRPIFRRFPYRFSSQNAARWGPHRAAVDGFFAKIPSIHQILSQRSPQLGKSGLPAPHCLSQRSNICNNETW